MKHLLIDENLPISLTKIQPVECSHATDIGRQPSDSVLWSRARERDWTVLTRDTDFFDRIMLQGPPPKVIWVRLGNIRKAELEKAAHTSLACDLQSANRRRLGRSSSHCFGSCQTIRNMTPPLFQILSRKKW